MITEDPISCAAMNMPLSKFYTCSHSNPIAACILRALMMLPRVCVPGYGAAQIDELSTAYKSGAARVATGVML